MGEEHIGAGVIEVEGFEAEFDGWKFSGGGRGVMRGAGSCIIIVRVRS